MTGCRIGRVRLKSGGADVHLLPISTASDVSKALVRNARTISECEGLTGYFIIGLYKDGSHNLGFRIDPEGVVGPTMAPSYVADIVRRATATRQEIIEMFEE